MSAPKSALPQPEPWLVLSERVFESIAAEPAVAEGLLKVRLAGKVLTHLPASALPERLQQLQRDGLATVHLVFDRLSADTMVWLRTLVNPAMSLRVYDWHESPIHVLAALRLPDTTLLGALAQVRVSGMAIGHASPAQLTDIVWWGRYRNSLALWESDARAEYGEAFELQFSASPLPWDKILPIADQPVATPASAAATATARLHFGQFALSLTLWKALSESCKLLWQVLFVGRGRLTGPIVRFHSIAPTLLAASGHWGADTKRALGHAFVAWPLLTLLVESVLLLPLSGQITSDIFLWSVFGSALLAMAGGIVCAPMVSVLGVGAGGVLMAVGFSILHANLAVLAGGMQAMAHQAAQIDPFILVAHGVLGITATNLARVPLAQIALLLFAPAAAIVASAWMMGRPAPMERRAPTTRLNTVKWSLIAACAGIGIPLSQALAWLVSGAMGQTSLVFPVVAAGVTAAVYGGATWVRTGNRRRAIGAAAIYGLVGVILWGITVHLRGSLAGLYLGGPATGFFHAAYFTLAYVVGLRYCGRSAAVLGASVEGCIGFVLANLALVASMRSD